MTTMTDFRLSAASRANLLGVHPDLVLCVSRAITITSVDFMVGEGMRTRARQRILFESGASQTMDSYHLTGDAVDLWAWVDGRVAWDWPLYDLISAAMLDAAEWVGCVIEWGGSWSTFRDGPHFQRRRE